MENKIPLLSICIPTYNREKYLKECLDSIITQEWFNEDDIEIVISDNASKDNTTELIKEYQNKFSNIRYCRNKENLGFDWNVLLLYSYWLWEYIWIMSDDDAINKDWLKEILYIIKNNKEFWTLQFNFGVYDKNLEKLEKLMFKKESKKFKNLNDLYEYHNYSFESIVYISNIIFKKDDNFIRAIKSNIPMTHYIHSCVNWLLFNNSIFYLNKEIVKYRIDNSDFNTIPDFKSLNNRFKICIIWFINYTRFLKKNNIKLNFNKLYFLSIIQIKNYFIWIIIFLTRKIWIYKILSTFWRKYILKFN